jgi:DNA-binding response OmpR family regulator
MRVLLVEDHAKLAIAVARGLRQEGMAVDVVFDGKDALAHTGVTDYDVIVLDRDLPLVHGDEVCRQLVTAGYTSRILMLTAARSIDDRVKGLSLGADDYLPKPFAFAELVARIRALARRPTSLLPPTLVHEDLQLDSAKRIATRDGRDLALSRKEFAVLELLLVNAGRPVTSEELLDSVWDEMTDPFTKTVAMTISRLRAKLGDPPLIETVPHGGYRI